MGWIYFVQQAGEAFVKETGHSVAYWLETFIEYFVAMRTATSSYDIYRACAGLVRACSGKTVVELITAHGDAVFAVLRTMADALVELCSDLCSHYQSGEEQKKNPFSLLREVMGNVEAFSNHPIIEKLKEILRYTLSFSLLEFAGIKFSTFLYSKAEAEYVKEKYSSEMGFAYSVLDGLSYILERLYDCHLTGSWTPLKHTTQAFGKWSDTVYAIKRDAQLLANPEATGVSYHEFLARLDDAIDTGRALVKYLQNEDKTSRTLCKRLLSEIELIKALELTKRAARESRDAPFSALLFAGSSVGKSTLQELIFSHLGKVLGQPVGSEYQYTRVYSDEFWSGFQTHMWCIFMDDIAARNPNLGDDASMNDVLQIINNVPFTPPQAELADKGKTPVRAKLVIASTNSKNLNAHAYYANPLAIQRRFPYVITATVKPEFSIQNPEGPLTDAERMNLFLDSRKAVHTSAYPSYWDLKVEKVVAQTDATTLQQTASLEQVLKTSDINEFLAFLSQAALEHESNQKRMRDALTRYREVDVCRVCFRASAECVCPSDVPQLQSSEYVVPALTAIIILLVVERIAKITRDTAEALPSLLAEGMREQFSPLRAIKRRFTRCIENSTVLDVLESIRAKARALALPDLEYEREQVKWHLSAALQKIRDNKLKSCALGGLLVLIPSCLVMAKLYRSLSLQGTEEVGGRLSPSGEKENVWETNEYSPSPMEFGRLTTSWGALSKSQVEERVLRNVAYAYFRYERLDQTGQRCTVRADMRLLALGGQVYVTNNHNIRSDKGTLHIVPREQNGGFGESYTVTLSNLRIHRVPEHDLMFLTIRNVPARASILELLPPSHCAVVGNGVMLSRSPSGVPDVVQFQNGKRGVEITELTTHTVYKARMQRATVSGECGSPYLLHSNMGPILVGIHVLGFASNVAACQLISREVADEAIAALKSPVIVPAPVDLTGVQGEEISLLPLHHKSTFKFFDKGVATVYGRLPGIRVGGKSKVAPTPLAPFLKAKGWECNFGAPVMRGWEPWRKAHLDIVQQEFLADQKVLDDCVAAFTADIIRRLPKSQYSELIVLDDEATVNGLPGVKFIDKMKRNTSMGYPWRCRKDKHMVFLGDHDIWQDFVEFTPEVKERINRVHDQLKQGIRAMPIFIEHLKDEPRANKKIEQKNTRVFSGCPVTFGFVMRKYLLTTVRVMQKNRYIFECAPGTNAASLEWDEMYHYLTQHGKNRIIAGDYSKFDKKMAAQFILGAFDVVLALLEKAGWEDEQLTVVRTMAYDIAFPVVDANGDLVQYWGSNPSGHPLTVIINSLVNSLYVRYAWVQSGHDLCDFKSQVALMTYGDDNTMGVHPSVRGFDHTILAAKLAEIGVGYTMADKEAESIPFVSLDDTSFLKRRWVYMPEVGSHVAQLELESIRKSLMVHIPSKTVCVEAQMMSSMSSALREMFFYGRAEYEQCRSLLQELVQALRWEAYLPESPWPTFDGMVAAYLEDNKDMSEDGRCATCIESH